MVVFCKRCGSPVKIENARIMDPAYSAKCQQCQRPVAIDALRPGARRTTAGPMATASTAGPAVGADNAANAPAAEDPAADRTHYLQKIRLFSGLPYEECVMIESRLRHREFAPHQIIVKEGGPGDAMFCITSGAVEVRKKDPHTGIEFLLSELKAGACFGEMALLTGQPRVASVAAVEPTSCSVLEQPGFDEVLLASSKVGLAMSRVLAERLGEADEQAGIEHMNLPGKSAESMSPASTPGSRENIPEPPRSEVLTSLEMEEGRPPDSVTDLSCSAEDAPIIRIANSILALAIKQGASDIHVEPQEKEVSVRFRIDGTLREAQVLPKKVQMGLISRLKIIAKLDIAERRLPQDGRITVRLEERSLDFRVSTVPSKWGEKICIRIRDKSNLLLNLDNLILHEEVLKPVREMISQAYGIIYVTGPAGSGKTTTVYGALAERNAPEVNISTVEESLEYDLARINQVQTHEEIGLGFARILRAFLRQDANIILVGETRDRETARLAVEAALAGRLVFTTLRSNTAAGAFANLCDLGVEPFLIASSTIGVIAQRLMRRLCQDCKEPYTPDDISLEYMGLDPRKQLTFYRHQGCDKCSGTGYHGRVGVYEVLRMNADLCRLVASGGNSEAISDLAIRGGMKTMKDYAGWLLQNGWTTMSEVLQVIPG